MVNGLIGSILDENGIKIQTLFPNIPKISSENQAKIEKLLDSRNRVKETIDDVDNDDFTDELNLANFFLVCRKYEEAIKYYDSALAKNPVSYTALCNKGLCLWKLSKIKQAEECYDKALDIYKNIPAAFFVKGKISNEKKEFEKAINNFEKAGELEPKNIEYKFNLGKCLIKTGRNKEGISKIEEIISEENHPESLLLLGQINFKNNEFEKSISYLEKLIEISPNHIDANIALGKSYLASNNFNQSIIHFQKGLERSPNNIESILQLGEVHLRINNFNDALEKFDKVLELSPNHPQALEQKISALEKMGNTEEAIQCCNAIEGVI